MTLSRSIAAALAAAALFLGILSIAEKPGPNRGSYTSKRNPVQHSWAQHLEKPGLKNFARVSDDLYRGAQPSPEGFQELKALGIKTDINLRDMHSDGEKLDGAGITYEHIHFKTWHPEDEDVVRFLRIVTDEKKGPFFVHCRHGSDRTGMMCAIYRVAVEGWTKDEAIEEMTKGDFGFHPLWQNLIGYIQGLDIEKIKKEAGI